MNVTSALTRVLVVDDEPEVAELVARMLEKKPGLVCGMCTSYEDTLYAVEHFQPSVMFLDINGPKGLELARKFGASIPIVLMSGDWEIKREELRECHVKQFLRKPVRREDLLTALTAAVG